MWGSSKILKSLKLWEGATIFLQINDDDINNDDYNDDEYDDNNDFANNIISNNRFGINNNDQICIFLI